MTTLQQPGCVDQGFVLELGHLGAQLLPVVGGKAATLASSSARRFRCHQGSASPRWLTSRSLRAPSTSRGRDLFAEQARAAIVASPVPTAVADAAKRAYRALGHQPVAVRSSATAEY